MKPLCACGGRATTTLRNNPICHECIVVVTDHESARLELSHWYDSAREPGMEPLADWADEIAEELRRDQQG